MNYTVEEQRIYDRGYKNGYCDGIDWMAEKAKEINHQVLANCTKENPCQYCRDMEAQHGKD